MSKFFYDKEKPSIWSHEGTSGCFIWLFALWITLVVSWLVLPDSFLVEGTLISMFFSLVGIFDIFGTWIYQGKLSKPGCIFALVNIVWFFLSRIPGSFFQLDGFLEMLLSGSWRG